MVTKVCTKCRRRKPVDEFSFVHVAKYGELRRNDCKSCRRKYHKTRYQTDPEYYKHRMIEVRAAAVSVARKMIVEHLKTHSCVDCGEPDPIVLEFDHVNGDKRASVSKLVYSGAGLQKIREEMDKCEVRCANCHRRITAKRRALTIGHIQHERFK